MEKKSIFQDWVKATTLKMLGDLQNMCMLILLGCNMANADFLNMLPERDDAMYQQPTEGAKALHKLCGAQMTSMYCLSCRRKKCHCQAHLACWQPG